MSELIGPFRNAALQLLDCEERLVGMALEESPAPMQQEEAEAAADLAELCLRTLQLLCGHGGVDLSDSVDARALMWDFLPDTVRA